MTHRRGFLQGLAAAALTPVTGWAAVGAPDFLSSGQRAGGQNHLFGLTAQGEILFEIPLPARGHAGAAHPQRAEAVAFARRPGTFAIVLDCRTGREITRLQTPEGHHFYGHGVFSRDGTRLFTTENNYEAAAGRIGVWDVSRGYTRIGSFASGGVGPHDMMLMPGGQMLVVANGGIETHPETGRTKLNLPDMQPNLSYLSLSGAIEQQVMLPAALRQNSIRHLDLRRDGMVAMGLQWQGDQGARPAMVALHQRGAGLRLVPDEGRLLNYYVGSVRFLAEGAQLCVTSPRGGCALIYDLAGTLIRRIEAPDVCGLGRAGAALTLTTGTGEIRDLSGQRARHDIAWDNHLVDLRRDAS